MDISKHNRRRDAVRDIALSQSAALGEMSSLLEFLQEDASRLDGGERRPSAIFHEAARSSRSR
ncbi:hypothetical protein ATB98_01850 [Sinorhizobium saheli]|uniref:Uncharacterized protein n=1 Tax=Sinorhizobium saheli TaxID=36856 RepID=A0A178XJM5_SINSA|nr:hypothetical protein ATB98_01850 [Sinorhizobium saheli]